MGELFLMNQPRRRRGGFGILGSSKGNSFAVGSGSPAPAVGPISPGALSSVLQTLNQASIEAPSQRITATGDTAPTTKTAISLPLRYPVIQPAAPPVVIGSGSAAPVASGSGAYPPTVASGSGAYPPTVASGSGAYPPSGGPAGSGAYPPVSGGGGGGGGVGLEDVAEGAAGEPAVFLGLTQKQLIIGGALALGAYLLLRKKRPAAAEEV